MPNEYYADDPPKLPSTGDYTCGCIGGNHPVECSNCRGNIWSYGKLVGEVSKRLCSTWHCHCFLKWELSQQADVGKQPVYETFKAAPYNFASRIMPRGPQLEKTFEDCWLYLGTWAPRCGSGWNASPLKRH
ncbi:hypothetical protein KVR01_001165 [Diaporthe batatas]|uniref:uncharacterized protein n=1 Tax=Diaporthe batatas TaxID=748121 RepID=UPI001D040644|nr:uncharacterized protein KVR01_001165 [Diaporthe batatas]KAG8168416.1 hypothetical protein KVR01_001165 [Diaporthe batatas]